MDEKVDRFMRVLDCTEAEAKDIIAQDAIIDKGGNPFPLTEEQEKASKKARGVGRQPTAYKFAPRERKTNPTKQTIITLLTETLTAYGATDLNVSNAEREFLFTLDGTKYKVVLSCPRK